MRTILLHRLPREWTAALATVLEPEGIEVLWSPTDPANSRRGLIGHVLEYSPQVVVHSRLTDPAGAAAVARRRWNGVSFICWEDCADDSQVHPIEAVAFAARRALDNPPQAPPSAGPERPVLAHGMSEAFRARGWQWPEAARKIILEDAARFQSTARARAGRIEAHLSKTRRSLEEFCSNPNLARASFGARMAFLRVALGRGLGAVAHFLDNCDPDFLPPPEGVLADAVAVAALPPPAALYALRCLHLRLPRREENAMRLRMLITPLPLGEHVPEGRQTAGLFEACWRLQNLAEALQTVFAPPDRVTDAETLRARLYVEAETGLPLDGVDLEEASLLAASLSPRPVENAVAFYQEFGRGDTGPVEAARWVLSVPESCPPPSALCRQ